MATAAQEPFAAAAGAAAAIAAAPNAKPLITLPKPGPIYDLHGKMLDVIADLLLYYRTAQRLGITSREPFARTEDRCRTKRTDCWPGSGT